MMNDSVLPHDDFQSDDFSTSFEDALKEMQHPEDVLPSEVVLYGLANLSPSDAKQLRIIWQAKDVTYRRILLQTLIEIADSEYQYDYQVIGEVAMMDEDALIRQLGIELTAENDSLELMNRFMHMLTEDTSNAVRTEAIRALGNFIRKGELNDIPQKYTLPARQIVFDLLQNVEESAEIRRFALESASHCTDERLPAYIQKAYQSGDEAMQRSSIVAMGHSCDERWASIVLDELANEDLEMRMEAARAAGNLELEEAVPALETMLVDTDRDRKSVV